MVGRGQEVDIVERIRAEELTHIYPQQHLVHAASHRVGLYKSVWVCV